MLPGLQNHKRNEADWEAEILSRLYKIGGKYRLMTVLHVPRAI